MKVNGKNACKLIKDILKIANLKYNFAARKMFHYVSRHQLLPNNKAIKKIYLLKLIHQSPKLMSKIL